MIHWQWSPYADLSRDDLYRILRAREAVFVVEQACAYQDCDGLDHDAWHLIGWDGDKRTVAAYLRVVHPGSRYPEPSIGRVLTAASHRGIGLGRKLTGEALRRTQQEYPGRGIRISAQQHLERFYGKFGFAKVAGPYDEDGIPHIEMLRPGGADE